MLCLSNIQVFNNYFPSTYILLVKSDLCLSQSSTQSHTLMLNKCCNPYIFRRTVRERPWFTSCMLKGKKVICSLKKKREKKSLCKTIQFTWRKIYIYLQFGATFFICIQYAYRILSFWSELKHLVVVAILVNLWINIKLIQELTVVL